MPAPAYTAGPVAAPDLVTTAAKTILAANPQRVGAFVCNASGLSTVFLAIGPKDPTTTQYSWRLKPGEQVMLPLYGAIQEIRAIVDQALVAGQLAVTEFTTG